LIDAVIPAQAGIQIGGSNESLMSWLATSFLSNANAKPQLLDLDPGCPPSRA